jgi:hypothetical protein
MASISADLVTSTCKKSYRDLKTGTGSEILGVSRATRKLRPPASNKRLNFRFADITGQS